MNYASTCYAEPPGFFSWCLRPIPRISIDKGERILLRSWFSGGLKRDSIRAYKLRTSSKNKLQLPLQTSSTPFKMFSKISAIFLIALGAISLVSANDTATTTATVTVTAPAETTTVLSQCNTGLVIVHHHFT